MSERPQLPAHPSRQELRKAVIRLRLEVQRQELRQETQLLLHPLRQARDLGAGLRRQLPDTAPLWAAGGGAALLALLVGRNRRLRRLLRLGLVLLPLLLRAKAENRPEATREHSA